MLDPSSVLPPSGCGVPEPGSPIPAGEAIAPASPAGTSRLEAARPRGLARLGRAAAGAERSIPTVLVACVVAALVMFWPATDDVFELPKLAVVVVATLALAPELALLTLRRHDAGWGPTTWTGTALLVYVLLVAAATLRSPDPIHSLTGEPYQFQGMIAAVCYAVAFLAARHSLTTYGRLRTFASALVLAGGIAASYGLLQQAGLDPVWDELDKGRIFSTLGQANALAAALVLVLPLGLGLWLTAGMPGRVFASTTTLAAGAALALTMSRGGYLGALIALGAFAALVRWRPALTRRRLGYALASLAAMSVIASALPPVGDAAAKVVERVQLIADPAEGSAASHLDLWAVGVRIALDHPLLGVGPEIYPDEFAAYRDAVLPPARAVEMARFRPESPHSVPLAIADGAGLPALGAYLALVVMAVTAGLRRLREAASPERTILAALLAAGAGHVVTDLFMTGEVAVSWVFWVLLGALAASRVGPEIAHAPKRAGVR